MNSLKSAKVFLFLAALLFVAKPFLGFSMFTRQHPPAEDNIFVKAFTKRKVEDSESISLNIAAIQKKLADPVKQFVLRFSFFLTLLFPEVLANLSKNITRVLSRLRLSLPPCDAIYLVNSKLII